MIKKFVNEIKLICISFGFIFALKYLLRCFHNAGTVICERSLRSVDSSFARDKQIKVKFKDNILTIAGDMLPTSREIFLKDCYRFDPNRKYEAIVDLGANRGNFSIAASINANRVIAVECDKFDMPQKFRETLNMNNISNVAFVNAFISNVDSSNSLSMNTLIKKYQLSRISFLKIDIEGAESNLFENNTNWLNICDQLSMEIHPSFNVNVSSIQDKIQSYGFHTTIVDLDMQETVANELNGLGYLYAVKI